jgi:anti-sigma-K factor RskA
MGLLTPLVKRRVEKFMQHDAKFEQEVIAWQERLSALNELPEPVTPPNYLKAKIMATVEQSRGAMSANTAQSWWQVVMNKVGLWQGIAMASLALLVVVLIQPQQVTQVIEKVAGGELSYVAIMESTSITGEAPLVISAYSKTDTDPSRLEFRWNDRQTKQPIDNVTLWAVDRDTGQHTALMQLADGAKTADLNADQWKAVKGSLELLIVRGDDFNGEVVMRGLCLQLASWQG